MSKAGVTLSSYNFYYFVQSTLKLFANHVKGLFELFHESFQDMCATYDPERGGEMNVELFDEPLFTE